jgi:TPR repeat protein
VDPVTADDDKIYEREAIEEWLRKSKDKASPVIPSVKLNPRNLRPNLFLKQTVAEMVQMDDVDEDLKRAWHARKHALDLKRARQLFSEGKVKEAAKLGLPKAQGIMAVRCRHGTDGQKKDLAKCVEWGEKAAAGGDRKGQLDLACAYRDGECGLQKNFKTAAKWLRKASNQGCAISMGQLGGLYFSGGPGLEQDFSTAAIFFERSDNLGNAYGSLNLGQCYYRGLGVHEGPDLSKARQLFKSASDRGSPDAMNELGVMMIKGEGGSRDIAGGLALIHAAVAAGVKDAKANLNRISGLSFAMMSTKDVGLEG